MAAGQRDTDSHGSSYHFPEYFRSHPFVKDLPRCGVFAMVVSVAAGPIKGVFGAPREARFQKVAELSRKLVQARCCRSQQQRRSNANGAYREAIRLNRDDADADTWYDFGSLYALTHIDGPLRKLMAVWSNSTPQKLVDVTVALVHDARGLV